MSKRERATPCFLLGDIGGTHLRFSLVPTAPPPAAASPPEVLFSARYPTSGTKSISAALAKLVADMGAGYEIVRCSLGVCGPVDPSGRTLCLAPTMGPGGWSFDAAEAAKALGLPADGRVQLLNDFVAVGLALPLVLSHGHVLHRGEPPPPDAPAAPLACLGPGTGLGACFCTPRLAPSGNGESTTWEVHPSEGGMADFSPRTPTQWALRQHIAKRLSLAHVEVERVISGTGLANICTPATHRMT